MKGLEISEIKLNELEFSGRIDSEYYKKEYINFENMVLGQPHKLLSEVSRFLIGPFGSAFKTENYESNSGYRYVRGQDVKPFILQDSDNKYLPEEDFKRLSKYSLKESDILVSVVGTLGNACLVLTKDLPAIFSCKSTVLRTKSINPVYLLTYLNSKYGRSLLLRKERGAIQKGLNLDDLKNLIVSYHGEKFQKQIETIFFKSQDFLQQSKLFHNQAEALLLVELGLKDWTPIKENTSVKNFSVSFLQSGRLDAEYYQPKYDELENALNKFKTIRIKDLVEYPVSSGSTPKAGDSSFYTDKNHGFPFIRAVDIKDNRVNTDDFIYIRDFVHNSILKKTKLKKNDVLFSIAGTVGRCGIFDYAFEANINQAVAVLRCNEDIINRLYLITFFNSPIGQMLVEKYSRQGLQTNLNLEELSNLYLPIIDKTIQQQITDKVQHSFNLKHQSKQLLNLAKQAVELAIEKGEEEAMKVIGEQA